MNSAASEEAPCLTHHLPGFVDDWSSNHVGTLAATEETVESAMESNTLLHVDIRTTSFRRRSASGSSLLSVHAGEAGECGWLGYHGPDGITTERFKATMLDVGDGDVRGSNETSWRTGRRRRRYGQCGGQPYQTSIFRLLRALVSALDLPASSYPVGMLVRRIGLD